MRLDLEDTNDRKDYKQIIRVIPKPIRNLTYFSDTYIKAKVLNIFKTKVIIARADKIQYGFPIMNSNILSPPEENVRDYIKSPNNCK